ncbi:ABC transporter permease [Demequina muriae]|uniref:Transport permease protein n=1 Tax=Demequina muriae TaxID=3051664 RepID=A0ABT8GG84_9MICO|nr:ABC transporter permease [Demequina sp. EGI L300058]MDN4480446.1 ABC transporter permease [Demequina sp. EGI L300058]
MTQNDYSALAREAGLERVGARPPIWAYLKDLWATRHFAILLARFRIEASLGENRLGLGWIVLRPILLAVIFGTIFGLILSRDTRPGVNFIPFLVVGIFIFEFFSKSFSAGAKSITSNSSLVRSMSFPRMLLPIAKIIQQVFELIPMLIVMGAILLIFGEPVTWAWLLVIPVMVLMTLFNTGVALIAARLTVHVRDVTQIIPLVTRVLFYSSGIFYSLEAVLEDRPGILAVAQLNPVHGYITLVRQFTVSGSDPLGTPGWIVVTAGAVVTFLVGVVFFWRAEERYGRD